MENALSKVTPLREGDVGYRSPPHNLEAEQALLAAILVNNSAYHKVAEFLRPEHFAQPVHGRIFAAIEKLIERGQIANPVTLANYFEQDNALQEIGGAQYLVRLAASVVTIINAEDYGRTIYDCFLRRQLIAIGEDVVNDAFAFDLERNASQQIETAEQHLFDLATSGQYEGGFQHFHEAMTEAVLMAEAAFKRSGKTTGVATGFTDLDKLLGGLHPSDLVIVAGRPSMGKTALATNIGFHAARNFRPKDEGGAEDGAVVGFFSLEMSAEQLATRILAEESGVPSHEIRQRQGVERRLRQVRPGEPAPGLGAVLHRRHAGAHHRRPAHPRAAPEAPAGAGPGDRRLSAAHPRHRPARRLREPRAGNLRDHPRPEGAGQGAGTCRCWRCRNCRARSSSARTSGRCCRTCANQARSSRIPTWSCSSSARNIT